MVLYLMQLWARHVHQRQAWVVQGQWALCHHLLAWTKHRQTCRLPPLLGVQLQLRRHLPLTVPLGPVCLYHLCSRRLCQYKQQMRPRRRHHSCH